MPSDRSNVTDNPARAVERLIWQEADRVQPEAVAVEKILADPAAAGRKVGLTPETVVAVIRSRPSFARWRQRREERAHEVEVADAINEPVVLTRRRISRSASGFVQPAYLVSLALILTGFAMDIIGHTNPYPYAPLAVFGAIFVGGGVGFGMISGGLGAHPVVVLAVTLAVIVALLAVGYYNLFGAQAWGL